MEKEKAIALAESRWWEGMPSRDVAIFQLNERLLCMDFPAYHKAVEEALGRPVWTHEFAKPEHLLDELYGNLPRPTMEDIINLIPKEKRLILISQGPTEE